MHMPLGWFQSTKNKDNHQESSLASPPPPLQHQQRVDAHDAHDAYKPASHSYTSPDVAACPPSAAFASAHLGALDADSPGSLNSTSLTESPSPHPGTPQTLSLSAFPPSSPRPNPNLVLFSPSTRLLATPATSTPSPRLLRTISPLAAASTT
ncbi:hypothetical protein B0I35DRAFT_230984 [Stachybotrys elegans]|uniref:Uncharacterized protein n=1 Tax=Stachybotrys elegans TaxID=80388 RepID=A0A8K0STK5_9HYPO|nr:hypothetical protein B0I35DRAFT_230984 [Stachybotrys elegans]